MDSPNQQSMGAEEAVATVIADLPRTVQDFILGPERDAIALQLTTKYQLHADQADVFEQSYIFMLLGIYTPQDFVQNMRKAGISEAAIQGLSKDVNEMVFMKLRTAEMKGDVAQPASPRPVPPPPSFINTPLYSIPVAPTMTPPTAPAPLPMAAPQNPISRPLNHIPTGHAPTAPATKPQTEPVSQLPKDTMTPAIPSYDTSILHRGYVPQQVTSPPAPSQPTQQKPPVAPSPMSVPKPPPPPTPSQSQNRDDLHKILKEYGVDPYREPLDNKS